MKSRATSAGSRFCAPSIWLLSVRIVASVKSGATQLRIAASCGPRFEGVEPDHRRDLIGRKEMLVVLHHDEVVGHDRAVGAERDDDVDVAVEQRLVLQTDVDQS